MNSARARGAWVKDVDAPCSTSILVVDDDHAVARTVARALEHHHRVVVASGGREALNLLAEGERFDAVISDIMMPGMTGLDLRAELLRLYPAMGCRIVFMTGGALSEETSELLARQGTPVLAKPFRPCDVLGAVDAVVALAGSPCHQRRS
jgi:two-component system NtrC family sensor kinase